MGPRPHDLHRWQGLPPQTRSDAVTYTLACTVQEPHKCEMTRTSLACFVSSALGNWIGDKRPERPNFRLLCRPSFSLPPTGLVAPASLWEGCGKHGRPGTQKAGACVSPSRPPPAKHLLCALWGVGARQRGHRRPVLEGVMCSLEHAGEQWRRTW